MHARASATTRPLALALALALLPSAAAQTEIADIEEGASASVAWTGLNAPVDIGVGADGSLYFAEFMTGKLRVIPPGASEPSPDPIWTAPNLQLGGERGFVGLGISPDEDNAFYVFYQHNKSGTVISRFSKIVDGSETVLIDDIRSGLLHNSGRIAFTPDGKALLSVGDATLDTIGRKASMHAHDPNVTNGKILRLNLDGSIPDDNPFANAVWSKGHRNVYGLAVSPSGVVLATENGPESWDEVNIIERGADYGWPTCSGACDTEGFVDPVLAYESTIAPTGAVWHEGAFYFTDFNKGSLHRVRPGADGAWLDERVLKFTTPRIIDVESSPNGLYVSTWDAIWRVVPAPVPEGAPTPDAPPTGSPSTATPAGGSPTQPTGPSSEPDAGASAGGAVPSPGVWVVFAIAIVAALVRRR